MRRCRRDILRKHDFNFLVGVADKLFSGKVLEEKAAAVFLLEKMDAQCGNREFRMFDSWLNRISSWADHDGLVHCLIAPMVAAKPARIKNVFRWAKSPKRWHRRAKMLFPEIVKLSDSLLSDHDDMVQKGLGWLLRETAKYDPKRTVPYLMKIRGRAPRLVLRTACELAPSGILGKGCSSQELRFFLWKAVEKGWWPQSGRVRMRKVSNTSGTVTDLIGAGAPTLRKSRRVGQPLVVMTLASKTIRWASPRKVVGQFKRLE
jgi:hypothetical protein